MEILNIAGILVLKIKVVIKIVYKGISFIDQEKTFQNKEEKDKNSQSIDKNPYLMMAKQQKATKKEINQFLKPFILNEETKPILYKSTALLALSKILAIGSPFFLKSAVNAISDISKMDINLAMLSIVGFGASRFLSTLLQEIRMNQVTQIIQTALKNLSLHSFNHLHQLDIYFHKVSSKNTVFAIVKAVKSMESALRFSLGFFAPVAFEFVLLCGTMYFYCGTPYLVNMLVTLSAYTAFSKWYSQYRQTLIRKNKNNEKKSEFYLNESMMNFETVKNYNNEKLESQRYQKLLNKIKASTLFIQETLTKLNVGQQAIYSLGLTINLLMSAWDVSNGRLTSGDFVMLQALFLQLSGPLSNMGTLFRQLDQSQVEMEDLYFVIKQQPLVRESPNAVPFQYKEGKIELKNLNFKHVLSNITYDKKGKMQVRDKTFAQLYLFNDLTISIKPKSTNAIVGYSGFGKTTLLNLMTRIYDPEEGQVLIDGQDLKDLTFESFRKYISVVPQNGILFNDSILFNLKYGNPQASMEEVIEIAKKCSIHETILKMEHGYDTQCGDLGSKLSGGERQRILIARALLKKDSEIFLFDEATSNLDPHIESTIADCLDEMLRDKTVIYCAHRLSSIINVDNIFVMADGKVAEQGTHWELMHREGSLYSQMWRDYLRDQEKSKQNIPAEILQEIDPILPIQSDSTQPQDQPKNGN
eukprot:403356809